MQNKIPLFGKKMLACIAFTFATSAVATSPVTNISPATGTFNQLNQTSQINQLNQLKPPPSQNAPAANNNSLFPVAAPKPLITPTAPIIRAKGYILLDAYSGKIIASDNADLRLSPASLTKMMTSYIVSAAIRSGRIHLDDKVHVSEKAWRTGGSKMFIKVNDEVPVRDLMQGIIVDSGNDASVAMAEFLAGSEESFANLMNQQAVALGMTGTHFMDANGLPHPQHYTTARDMAILARALIFNFPEDYKWYSQKKFTYNNITQPNRNRLLWRDQTVDGLKTGHTDEAGYCLVASAQRGSMRLISVVMGAPSDAIRADDTQKLLGYGFRFYETKKFYAANTAIQKARIWLGDEKFISIGARHDVYVTTSAGLANNLKAAISINNPIKAPVNKGDVLGTMQVSLNNEVVASYPLIALQADPTAGFFSRMTDYVRLGLHKVLGGENA